MLKYVNLRASGTVPNLRVYSAALPLGPHTIRVLPVGTSNGTGSWVTLDRFLVS